MGEKNLTKTKILVIGLLVIFLLSTEAAAFNWDFTIEASPVSQTVAAGDAAVFNIKVSAIQSWTTNTGEQTTVDVEFNVPATMSRSLSGPFWIKQSQPTDTRPLTLYTSPDTPPGTYQITLKGTVTSTSTTHSTTIFLIVINEEQSKPDLIIQDFYWTPSNPTPGDQVTFTYIEKNQGGGDATGHRVTLYIDDLVISSDNILETLPAGSTRTRTFSDKWTATSGGHDAFVKADTTGGTGGITESNEENNGLHKTIGTKETVPTALTINLNPSSISENQRTYLTISGKLKNSNSGSGISNRPVKLEWTGGMTTVTTDSNGDYSYATYVTYSKGTYQFSAKFDSYETSSAVYVLSSSTASLVVGEKSNLPPTAYIDSISPNPATKGENIYFSGRGDDPDGSISGYNWRSSIDGQLSTSESFSTSSLTQGTHTIYFKVKDDSGTWSSETTKTLIINPSQPALASIQSASVDKSSYNSGETIKVSVTIKNTGNVDLSGLKINVDIADPNENNIKATTLQNGISLSAGQTYSTGYISYYTIPRNPVSGTYKVTVDLWNSGSTQNYDVKYQTTSFSVSSTLETSQFEQLLNSVKSLGWNSIDLINTKDYSSTGKLSYQPISIENFKEPYNPYPEADWHPVLLEIPDRNNPDKKRLVALVTGPNNVLTQEYKKVKIKVMSPPNYRPGAVFVTLPSSDPLACTKIHYMKEVKEWKDNLVEKAAQEIASFGLEKIVEKFGVKTEPVAIVVESGLTLEDIISCVIEGPKVDIGQASNVNLDSWLPIGQKIIIEVNTIEPTGNKWEGVVTEDLETVYINLPTQIPGPVTATYQPTTLPIQTTNQPPPIVVLTFDTESGLDNSASGELSTQKILEYTPKIDKLLQEKGLIATFFIQGAPYELNLEFRNKVKSIALRNEIGSHSYSHPDVSIFEKMSKEDILNQLARTEEAIGEELKGYRNPHFLNENNEEEQEKLCRQLKAKQYLYDASIYNGDNDDPYIENMGTCKIIEIPWKLSDHEEGTNYRQWISILDEKKDSHKNLTMVFHPQNVANDYDGFSELINTISKYKSENKIRVMTAQQAIENTFGSSVLDEKGEPNIIQSIIGGISNIFKGIFGW